MQQCNIAGSSPRRRRPEGREELAAEPLFQDSSISLLPVTSPSNSSPSSPTSSPIPSSLDSALAPLADPPHLWLPLPPQLRHNLYACAMRACLRPPQADVEAMKHVAERRNGPPLQIITNETRKASDAPGANEGVLQLHALHSAHSHERLISGRSDPHLHVSSRAVPGLSPVAGSSTASSTHRLPITQSAPAAVHSQPHSHHADAEEQLEQRLWINTRDGGHSSDEDSEEEDEEEDLLASLHPQWEEIASAIRSSLEEAWGIDALFHERCLLRITLHVLEQQSGMLQCSVLDLRALAERLDKRKPAYSLCSSASSIRLRQHWMHRSLLHTPKATLLPVRFCLHANSSSLIKFSLMMFKKVA